MRSITLYALNKYFFMRTCARVSYSLRIGKFAPAPIIFNFNLNHCLFWDNHETYVTSVYRARTT